MSVGVRTRTEMDGSPLARETVESTCSRLASEAVHQCACLAARREPDLYGRGRRAMSRA